MVGSLLWKELQRPPIVLPQFHKVRGVVLVGNDRVGRAVAGNQEHTGLDGGQHSIAGFGGLFTSLGIARVSKLRLAQVPIFRASLALLGEGKSRRPGTDVADAIVQIEHTGAVGVEARPRRHIKPATGDAQQGRLGGKPALAVHFLVDLLPDFHRPGRTELVAHADIDHMPPFFDQSLLKCLQLSRKLPNPQPRISRGWLVRNLDRHGLSGDGDILDGGGRGAGAERESEQTGSDEQRGCCVFHWSTGLKLRVGSPLNKPSRARKRSAARRGTVCQGALYVDIRLPRRGIVPIKPPRS